MDSPNFKELTDPSPSTYDSSTEDFFFAGIDIFLNSFTILTFRA